MGEQTYTKIDLAIEQLDMALLLFLEKQSYVSALTLAGAAEEILGKALSHQGKQNFLEFKYQMFQPVYSMLSGASLVDAILHQTASGLCARPQRVVP